MKIEIQVYKGQTIHYDEDYDKFECEISVEDKFKTTKRQSLSDVRKEIDTFIKLNVDFKPFKALLLDYNLSYFKEIYVSAIRTDGKFIVSDSVDSSYKSHYGKKEMAKVMVYDYDAIKTKQKLKKELDELKVKYDTLMKEVLSTLTPIDLSKYEHIINQ